MEAARGDQPEEQQDRDRADEPDLLTDRREDEVGWERAAPQTGVDQLRMAEPQTGARQAAGSERERRLRDLTAGAVDAALDVCRAPRMQPRTDADRNVREVLVRVPHAAAEHDDAGERIRAPGRRGIEGDHEQGEEQRGRAEVSLVEHDREREAPRKKQWAEVPWGRQAERADARGCDRHHLTLRGEVPGQEDREHHFRELGRLERERTEPDPQLHAASQGAPDRRERQQQQRDAQQQERIAELLELPVVPDDRQRRDEGDHADRDPTELRAREVRREPADVAVSEAREQDRDRIEQWVGGGREPADGDVTQHGECREPKHELHQVRGHLRRV